MTLSPNPKILDLKFCAKKLIMKTKTMKIRTIKKNNFSKVSKNRLGTATLLTINNLYEVLENCQSEKEHGKVSGCIYLLEMALYDRSSVDPFVNL